MSDPIRVLIVDNHTLFRLGLEVTLEVEDDIEVVGSTVDGVAATTLASETLPDVVLIDLFPPYKNGIRTVRAIKRTVSTVRILIFTASNVEVHLFAGIRAGAVGHLLKSGPVNELAAAIRSVHGGTSLISPRMAALVMSEFAAMARSPDERMPAPRPTSRELEVIKLLVGAHTDLEIARLLSISENTVKNHVRNILAKIQLYARMSDLM